MNTKIETKELGVVGFMNVLAEAVLTWQWLVLWFETVWCGWCWKLFNSPIGLIDDTCNTRGKDLSAALQKGLPDLAYQGPCDTAFLNGWCAVCKPSSINWRGALVWLAKNRYKGKKYRINWQERARASSLTWFLSFATNEPNSKILAS